MRKCPLVCVAGVNPFNASPLGPRRHYWNIGAWAPDSGGGEVDSRDRGSVNQGTMFKRQPLTSWVLVCRHAARGCWSWMPFATD